MPFEVRPKKNTFYVDVLTFIIAFSLLLYFLLTWESKNGINSLEQYCFIAVLIYLIYTFIFRLIHYLKRTPVISIDHKSVKILSTLRFRVIPWNKIKSCKTEITYGVDYFVIETSSLKKKIMISYFDQTPEKIDSVIKDFRN